MESRCRAASLVFILIALVAAAGSNAAETGGNAKATRPVAAWDVVPHQIFDKALNVGVVAFHETGCRVVFTVKAGDAAPAVTKTVERPTRNEQTNVWEYWIALDPKSLPDGPVTVNAKVEPLGAGMIPRELDPLPLFSNGGGTLKFGSPVWVDCNNGDDAADGSETQPLKTLKAAVAKAPDGGTILLKAGKGYSADGLGGGLKRRYWTTITALPSAKAGDVEIGPGRPGTDKLRFQNVTLYSDPPSRKYNTILSGEQDRSIVWVDGCTLRNKKGRWDGGGVAFGNRYVAYVTGGLTTEMDNGPGGVLMRGHRIVKITSDAFTGVHTAINCSVEDINPGQTGAHPDFHQSYVGDKSKFNHVILYNCRGVRCISQGFFGHNLQDSAFVNCLFHKGDTVMYSQYSGPMDHVLFLHLSVPNQTWLWREGLEAKNCFMINCVLAKMGTAKNVDVSGITFQANHFLDPDGQRGEGATSGRARFPGAAKFDYGPVLDSPLDMGGVPLQCVPADADGRLYNAKSPARGYLQGK